MRSEAAQALRADARRARLNLEYVLINGVSLDNETESIRLMCHVHHLRSSAPDFDAWRNVWIILQRNDEGWKKELEPISTSDENNL